MPALTPFSEAAHLFRAFQHTAWRLETRGGYASDRESPKWRRFVAGEDIAHDPPNAWRQNVAAQVGRGKRFERVRVVDDPPTEGQLFLLASGVGNVTAGEEIRNIFRADARRLGLPEHDFWLFDSRLLMKFVFDDDDRTLGVELIDAQADVLAACQARDAAWHHAERTGDFTRRVRSTA